VLGSYGNGPLTETVCLEIAFVKYLNPLVFFIPLLFLSSTLIEAEEKWVSLDSTPIRIEILRKDGDPRLANETLVLFQNEIQILTIRVEWLGQTKYNDAYFTIHGCIQSPINRAVLAASQKDQSTLRLSPAGLKTAISTAMFSGLGCGGVAWDAVLNDAFRME
jgi:hypothetical protein